MHANARTLLLVLYNCEALRFLRHSHARRCHSHPRPELSISNLLKKNLSISTPGRASL